MLRTIPIEEAANVAVRGRVSEQRQPLPLFWSASGLEMNFRGTELALDVETDFSMYEQWISVVLNGAHVARFPLAKGRSLVPILRGLNPERVHHIAILRDVQAMPTDEACCLLVHGLRADGEFLPLAQKQLRLEVIGDSITSAEAQSRRRTGLRHCSARRAAIPSCSQRRWTRTCASSPRAAGAR